MASGVFSSIQSLSTKLLEAIRGTTSISHHQDPASPVSDQNKSVREDLEKLGRMLKRIQVVQQDAEEREIHDRSVGLWLEELRGVAYQADDVLDEFYYEVLRSIVESGDAAIEAYHRDGGTKRKFVEMCTLSSLASYSFTTKVSIPDGMVEKIKGITERFEEISNARRDLHLREEDGTRLVIGPQIQPPTSSRVDKRAIFGREEEKEKIISLLDLSNGPDFMVLPIVGMGGFGKTTLAQLVYNDSRIHELFRKICWVHVSQDFDLVKLTKAIVESVSCNLCEFSELSKLQDVLNEKIRGFYLFLVLDDVWNEKRNLWECFRVGFFGAKFVRILMTTRNTSVAKVMQTTTHFQLGSLPEENCWTLFKHFAFGNGEASENENLLKIGRSIVLKCKGSPLAIKALGGILRYEMDEEKWREILESDISEIDETGEVMPALRLSYHKLPRHLKPCFLYLSMFPKGTLLEKDMVVRLWMAQGYINGDTRNLKTLEEIGSEYFDELQGRSLVERVPVDLKLSFTYSWHDNLGCLHDLIHDLVRSISQGAYQHVLENDQQCSGPYKVYHIYLTEQDKLIGSFLAPNNNWSIRTVVNECPTQNFDSAIFSEIACVRALQVRYSMLPNTLGMLKHLRYLSIGNSNMEMLPETLCLLYNLQTLNLNTFYLRELPEKIKNLINLRYFQLSSREIQLLPESIFMLRNLHTLSFKSCTGLQELPRGIEQVTRLHILKLPVSIINMPSGIGKLTTLKPLSGDFNVMGNDMIGGLGELKDMNKLGGLLCISGLINIGDVEHSRNANLASKPNLRMLVLNFREDRRMLYCTKRTHLHLTVISSKNAKNENDGKIEDAVLQSLQPHGNLTTLHISNYGGRIFPSWLNNSSLPKLTSLNLNFCTEPYFLPPFDQLPYLKFLNISGNTGVRNVGDECRTYSLLTEYGSSKQPKEPSYPSLEELSLRNMLNLVQWKAHDDDFPNLKWLTIENCPKLWEIPVIPQEVRNVTFEYCPKLKLLRCPSLIEKLRIHECGFCDIMFGSVSKNLTISNCAELISINWREGSLNSVRKVSFEYCPKLEFLVIPVGILKLGIHECGFCEIMFRSVYENLTISSCLELISINWKEGGLNSIGQVSFLYCPKLEVVDIPVGILKMKIHECGFRKIIFWSVSENLTISNCLELISINYSDGGLISVEEFSFEHCPKFILPTIPRGIKKLKISYSSIQEIIFPLQCSIQMLDVIHCPLLTSIHWVKRETLFHTNLLFEDCPELQKTLKKVRIAYCPILQFPVKDVLHSMTQRAEIYDCPKMHLGERYIYQRDTTITELNLSGNNEIHLSDTTIPLLKDQFTLFLTKEDFREVESSTCAPSFGVSCQNVILNLASLVILVILRCRKVISLTGLDNLINLKRLSISCCPELCNWNDKTLPLSLEFLKLNSCNKLSSLPLLSDQNHSNTLNILVIKKCPKLAVLEGFHGLMKLTTVKLLHCRNISISPSTGSLHFRPHFTIHDCPLMRDWCERNTITYYELNLFDDPRDDTEDEDESAVVEILDRLIF